MNEEREQIACREFMPEEPGHGSKAYRILEFPDFGMYEMYEAEFQMGPDIMELGNWKQVASGQGFIRDYEELQHLLSADYGCGQL